MEMSGYSLSLTEDIMIFSTLFLGVKIPGIEMRHDTLSAHPPICTYNMINRYS